MKIALAPSTQSAEYARNLAVAQACKPVLETAGVECRIFSSPPLPGDSTAGQSQSNREMQEWGPTLTFALHNDSLGSSERWGQLVLIDDDHPELAPIAEAIGKLAAAKQGIRYEGLRLDSRRFVFWEYSGKGGPPTPNCILWENGNMDSAADMERLNSTIELQGRALAEAIIEYYEVDDMASSIELLTEIRDLLKSIRYEAMASDSFRQAIHVAVDNKDLDEAARLLSEATAKGFRNTGFRPQS